MSELKVFHLPGRWDLKSVSPFCLKLDAFLRIADIPHHSITASTPFGGPKTVSYTHLTLPTSDLV